MKPVTLISETDNHWHTSKISSIAQFLTMIEDDDADPSPPYIMLFRGQPVDKPLLPKVARPLPKSSSDEVMKKWSEVVVEREKWLFREFKRQMILFGDRVAHPTTDGDILCYGQHHGLPTRLLDWSQNPLAALFFALDAADDDSLKPTIWRFKVNKSDIVSPGQQVQYTSGKKLFKVFDPKKTIVFRPNHVTERIRVQSGWFTVHPITTKAVKPLETLTKYSDALTKYSVMANSKKLRIELDRMGVNKASLYPDSTNLSAYLQWKCAIEIPFSERSKL